ncbi:IclR family transcriptional regulator [Halobellus rufus]|uniref:IclR family transcriptional regulator n=1 Tax=Halobellus rufus TaxID=1448860 RepID=UPI0009DD2E9C|nr:IclR family transcriptional regulator [Halobellus rufus]
MTGSNNGGRRVKTADNIIDIIDVIDANDGATVTDIAKSVELAKSTVHEYLYTLTDRGYFVNKDGTYYLGLKFYKHGLSARDRYNILDVVEPTLDQLAEETGEAAWFIVEEHGKAIYLANALGDYAVQTHARVGQSEYLHCIATGNVILAHMPPERVSEIIERYGLPAKTPDTITDEDELHSRLADIREDGYGTIRGEAAKQISAIAVPVFTEQDNLAGGICISGPTRRMEQKGMKTKFLDLLLTAADEISLRFDWER